jgi:[ribosomal protein S5]-alanine N-acetyltransferase
MSLPELAPITSPRLVVRQITPADLPALLAVNGDEAVTRFLPYAHWTGLADAEAWLTRMQALAEGGSARQCVIERRSEPGAIGTLLLFRHEPGSARLEIGYVLGRAHWRQGYAREALQAVCSHLFHAAGIRRIEAEVNPDNEASTALLLSLGFVREGLLRQRWQTKGLTHDTAFFGCLASEWQHGGTPTDQPGPAR